jgi:hypothetical protein
MLSWLPRRQARIEIEAEAEALIRDFGEAAYSEACRREHGASSRAIARDWGSVALAVALLIGKRTDVDPLLRLAMNAVLVPDREDAAPHRRRSLPGLTPRKPRSLPDLTPEAELTRVIPDTTHRFRIQFVGAAPNRGPTTLREVEIQVPDVSAAIVAAASIAWPPRTTGVRILDDTGREVFKRQRAHRRSA